MPTLPSYIVNAAFNYRGDEYVIVSNHGSYIYDLTIAINGEI